MGKREKIIEKRDIIIIGGVLAFMMLIGSIWDYPISLALYNASNPFGLFFAAYGEAPAMLGLIMSGALLFAARNGERKTIGILQMIGGAVLILMGGAMLLMLPGRYITLPTVVNALIAVAVTASVIYLSIHICRSADRSTVIKVAAAMFAIIFLEMLLINIIKIPWGRPRMRMIATGVGAEFAPWWVIGNTMKRQLMAAGVAGEEFKSFPSGHTANGAVLILLSVLPVLNNALRQKARLLFYIGAAWGLLVALSRVVIGAHFITDVTVGFALTFAICLIVTSFMLERKQSGDRNSQHAVASRSGRTD